MDKKPSKRKPTFDEWYAQTHGGFSFDAHYLKPTDDIGGAVRALTRMIRAYVTEIVQDG